MRNSVNSQLPILNSRFRPSKFQRICWQLGVGGWALALMLVAWAVPAAQAQTPSSQPAAAPSGNAEAGKKLYESYGCYQCHGREAQGSSATGPRLGPKPIAFAAFSRYVRRPTGQMPPYTSKVVSDSEMADIYAFVQTRPAPAQSVPLLREP